MTTATEQAPSLSPFHAGEQALQTRVGKREAVERFGRVAVRPFMPDQHREFFEQLPFVVIGGVDGDGWPWASIVSGEPGFVRSPTRTELDIGATLVTGDPLKAAVKTGAPIGFLGIELGTRRRNRMNAHIGAASARGFTLNVDQSFGNCPQYIQTRTVEFARDPKAAASSAVAEPFTSLDDTARDFIAAADTFFVSSFLEPKDRPEIEGVDVSHRGGRAGFVKVDGDTLTVPDYSGNHIFNTLGNFLLNPKAGLIFPDFATGDVLMLTGTVELLWEDAPEVRAFQGAERGWRFTLDHGVRLKDALPFRAALDAWSPNSLMAGDWAQAEARMAAEAEREAWRPFRIAKIVDESSVIRSFHLEPADGKAAAQFEAGQFLTVRVTPEGADRAISRTYTVSSPPEEDGYRISVKREAGGVASNHLHDRLKPGDVIEAKAPKGAFHIDATEKRPAVLLAGGVGVTPMISMARHVLQEGMRTRNTRPLTVLHAATTTKQLAFVKEFRALEHLSQGAIRYFSFVSQPGNEDKPGIDYNGAGRITADALRQVLSLDDYDFFLCGPASFMQALYDILRALGVRDRRIFAEAFGPASLVRAPDDAPEPAGADEADTAIVSFVASGFEQRWSKGDATLLETAEAHGLTPEFSCRSGACGSCATRKLSGEVSYRTPPTADHAADEVLICCAVPAAGVDTLELDL